MGTGIIVCGLNGAGKSTIGKALADRLGFHFIDIEDLYFPKTDPDYIYSSPRSYEEVKALLKEDIKAHKNFVFSAVKGNYGDEIYSFFKYAVLIEVPVDIRMERVRNRSFAKFGSRMEPGGDLYEQEEKFFEFVRSRDESLVKQWLEALNCPVISLDGTKAIEENIDFLIDQIEI